MPAFKESNVPLFVPNVFTTGRDIVELVDSSTRYVFTPATAGHFTATDELDVPDTDVDDGGAQSNVRPDTTELNGLVRSPVRECVTATRT